MTEPPELPPPRRPWWWPLATSTVGLVMCLYEMAFDKLDRPYIITAGAFLAVGGKAVDRWFG